MKRQELIEYLANLLETNKFHDYCVNGLQVEGSDSIDRIITGVSISRRLIAEAVTRKAEAIIVHHGLFWKSDSNPMSLTGILADRVRDLMMNNINLLAYHLPLDSHPTLGNNAQIALRLGMEAKERVDIDDWIGGGLVCEPPEPISRAVFLKYIDGTLDSNARLFPFGPDVVKRVFVCSGGSSDFYRKALEYNCDTFLGGDIRESVVRLAEEAGLNFIAAGHYNTEKPGILALGDHLIEKLNLDVQWIDIPNPV
jgi:dinuclear metal center YbgI/SA1388 family protein